MMKALMVAGVLLAAIAGSPGCGGEDRRPSRPVATATTWRALAPLPRPRQPGLSVDGASLTVVGGVAHVVVTYRSGDDATSDVVAFRETHHGWRRLAQTLVDRDAPVSVVGGRRLCIAGSRSTSVTVSCLEGGAWKAQGPPFAARGSSLTVADARAAPGADGIDVAVVRRVAPSGRFLTSVERLSDGRWRTLGADQADGDVAWRYPGGSQRALLVRAGRRLCVAYNGLRGDLTYGPDIAVSCLRARRWTLRRELAPRPAAVERTGPQTLSGAVARGDEIAVGVQTLARGGAWDIHLTRPGGWRRPATTGGDAPWSRQGSLYDLDGGRWAVRFDQRGDAADVARLATRVVVLHEVRGAWVPVGAPLRDATTFTGPVYYGLAAAGGRLLAMTTLPASAAVGQDVAVFELRRRQAR